MKKNLNTELFYIDSSGAVRVNSRLFRFTDHEEKCLQILLENGGKVCTFRMLLQRLYESSRQPMQKIIDVYICKIRSKLNKKVPGLENSIVTVWGRGYRLEILQQAITPPPFLPSSSRWCPSRKADVVEAVVYGKVDRDDLFTYYPDLSEAELLEWEESFDKFGMPGLRTTRTQQYVTV